MTKNKPKNSTTSSKNAKKSSTLNLPRGYLSWSQIDLWNRNRQEYIQIYFHGKQSFTNQAMDYGKKFALAMEKGEDEDEILKAVSIRVPRFSKPEFKLEAVLETEWGGVPLLGFIDSSQDNPLDGFREYKTGQHPWTQRKADTHGQLTLYALMVYIREKKLPKEIFLDWIETQKDDEGTIYATGKIVTFQTSRQIGDLLEMSTIIKRTASDIHSAYTNFLTSLL